MAKFAEESGEEFDLQSHYNYGDIRDNERDYLFSFCSYIRTASDDDVKNEKQFLEDFFINQNAWLPNCEYMPYFDENGHTKLSKSLFARVDFVKV